MARKGIPGGGTPTVEPLLHDHQESDEKMAQRAIDKSFSNSHANLMNEGEDDDWRGSWKRSEIEDRRRVHDDQNTDIDRD